MRMFDTRSKIVSLAQFLAQLAGPKAPKAVVAGPFDPFFDQHAERLRQLATEAGPLAVLVTAGEADEEQPLLDVRARAELAAANAHTCLVAVTDGAELPALPKQQLFDDRALHAEWRRAMMRHVVERNAAAR